MVTLEKCRFQPGQPRGVSAIPRNRARCRARSGNDQPGWISIMDCLTVLTNRRLVSMSRARLERVYSALCFARASSGLVRTTFRDRTGAACLVSASAHAEFRAWHRKPDRGLGGPCAGVSSYRLGQEFCGFDGDDSRLRETIAEGMHSRTGTHAQPPPLPGLWLSNDIVALGRMHRARPNTAW